MIRQRAALLVVTAVMLLVLFTAKGRHRNDTLPVAAFCAAEPPVAWLQLGGAIRNQGTYPLSDIIMTQNVIIMADPLCPVRYDQAALLELLKKDRGARLDITCPADTASGLVTVSPLSAHQGFVLFEAVALNTATSVELCLVPGIGPVLAQRIVQYRQTNGGFGAFHDLLQVEGIGEKKLEALMKYLTI